MGGGIASHNKSVQPLLGILLLCHVCLILADTSIISLRLRHPNGRSCTDLSLLLLLTANSHTGGLGLLAVLRCRQNAVYLERWACQDAVSGQRHTEAKRWGKEATLASPGSPLS